MTKIHKILFASLSFISLFGLNSQAIAQLNGGSSTVAAGQSPYKSFSQDLVGTGISLGKRFEIAEEIFTDSDSKNKTKDHIFGEVEGFANHFFSGEIKQNYGGRANIGYEIKGFRAFISGGYVLSSIDYQESGNQKQSVSSWSPFIGVGIGYDITKNVGVRLNSMFYNFDFKPKNSEFRNTEIDVTALSLGLAVHF